MAYLSPEQKEAFLRARRYYRGEYPNRVKGYVACCITHEVWGRVAIVRYVDGKGGTMWDVDPKTMECKDRGPPPPRPPKGDGRPHAR